LQPATHPRLFRYNPRMTRTLPLLLAAVALAAPLRAADTFSSLAGDYWKARMRRSPLTATFNRYPGYDDKLDDNTPEGLASERKEWAEFRARLKALPISRLSPQEQVSAALMDRELDESIGWLDRPAFRELAIDHMDGPQSWIPSVIQAAQPMASDADAGALLKRMGAMPAFFGRYEQDLKDGLAHGRAGARVPVEKTIRQLDEMLAVAASSTPYAEAAGRLPAELRAKRQPEILALYESAVAPALRELRRFLHDEYLPKARDGNIGLSGVAGGKELYRWQIRHHTTVDKSPAELHKLGLDELASIRAEMEAIRRRRAFAGDLESFLDSVRKDPKNFFTTRDEVRLDAERLVAKATAKLPDWFATLPKTPLVVKPVEEYQEKNEAAARYWPPADDGSRPGIYYINTWKPESRPRFSMTSLAAHEGVPGHHLQIALAMENKDLPEFRRHAEFTAYVEGWALYSERLADEMGLYEDDLSRLGMLSEQAWRAARLVVDTGLHDEGWTRERAVDFMMHALLTSRDEVETEVDRYTVWPGQALAYKVGQREISALRDEVKAKLGRRFDIRAFHDSVLRPGPLPLPLLRRVVLQDAAR
jgi:uncharacterized protein (DUF885 family)